MSDKDEHSAQPTVVPENKPSDAAPAVPEPKPVDAAPTTPETKTAAPEPAATPASAPSVPPVPAAPPAAKTTAPATPAAVPTDPAGAPADAATTPAAKTAEPVPTAEADMHTTFKFSDNNPVNQSQAERDTLFAPTPASAQAAAIKSAGQTCPKCGHVNRAGILVCEKCGTLLISDEHAGGTKRFEAEKKAAEAGQGQPAVLETTELFTSVVTSAGSALFTENMVLRLEIEGAPTPILLHPKFETSLGRRDPATGTMPDVDLSAYAGYRLGVSRKHAIIRLKNRQLELYDLGSSNGTSINGTRLNPHQSQVLRDGDEVMLGKMMLRVLFQVRNKR